MEVMNILQYIIKYLFRIHTIQSNLFSIYVLFVYRALILFYLSKKEKQNAFKR